MRKDIIHRVLAIVLVTTMILTIGNIMTKKTGCMESVSAQTSAISNPRWGNGGVTWDIVEFGSYQQSDGDKYSTTNQKEPVQWRVLSVDGDKVFLLSEKIIDCMPYHEKKESVTWESCSLRTWLNEVFIKEAFSTEEQKAIMTTNVDNSGQNLPYNTSGGKDTSDKIFLLSLSETLNEDYGFDKRGTNTSLYYSTKTRTARATDYALKQGAYICSDNDGSISYLNSYWWLRMPGYGNDYAAYVSSDGNISSYGADVNYEDFGIRPALCVNKDAVTLSGTGFAEVEYKVSFMNGTGSTIESQTIAYGSVATKPAEPTWSDHTFAGWFSDLNCTTPYDFSAPITDDVTVYSGWNVAKADTDLSKSTNPSVQTDHYNKNAYTYMWLVTGQDDVEYTYNEEGLVDKIDYYGYYSKGKKYGVTGEKTFRYDSKKRLVKVEYDDRLYWYASKNKTKQTDSVIKIKYSKAGKIKKHTKTLKYSLYDTDHKRIDSESKTYKTNFKYRKKDRCVSFTAPNDPDEQNKYYFNKKGALTKYDTIHKGKYRFNTYHHYYYDKKGNIKKLDGTIFGSNGKKGDSYTIKRKLIYKSGRLVKQKVSNTTTTYKYKKVRVVKKYAKQIKEQQWRILNFAINSWGSIDYPIKY